MSYILEEQINVAGQAWISRFKEFRTKAAAEEEGLKNLLAGECHAYEVYHS